jgi:hypothetical protein
MSFDVRTMLVRALKINPGKFADLILLHVKLRDAILEESMKQLDQNGPLASLSRDLFGYIYSFLDIRDHARLSVTALFAQSSARLPVASPHKLVIYSQYAAHALKYAQRFAFASVIKVEIHGPELLRPSAIQLLGTLTRIRELTANLSPIDCEIECYSSLSSLVNLERLYITHKSDAHIPFASFVKLTDIRVSSCAPACVCMMKRCETRNAGVSDGFFLCVYVCVCAPCYVHCMGLTRVDDDGGL